MRPSRQSDDCRLVDQFGYGMHTSWFGAWQVGVNGASRGAPFGAQARRLHKVDCAGRREHDAVISAGRLA